jgi:hypothetical protein
MSFKHVMNPIIKNSMPIAANGPRYDPPLVDADALESAAIIGFTSVLRVQQM